MTTTDGAHDSPNSPTAAADGGSHDAGSATLDARADALPDGGFDFDDFAALVRAANDRARQDGDGNCAAALPSVEVVDTASMHKAITAFVGRAQGAAQASVNYGALPCGGANFADCGHEYQHALFKADGRLGGLLLPLATVVDQSAEVVEDASWTPHDDGGLASGLAVTIAGIKEGRLLGIAWFGGRSTCAL
jgi:hypothetical protein